ncbi:MAG: hypothetical protein IMY70_01735 [Bacteroidetes bacterium]|nr:hypothetical protein [Bacteroidota bacterium]
MKMLSCTKGQMNTFEGLAAALIIIYAVLFISQSSSIVMPQSNEFINTQLQLYGNDALLLLDKEDFYSNSQLKKYVAGWDGVKAGPDIQVSSSLIGLDKDLNKLLPDNVAYNVDFLYAYNGSIIEKPVIYHGVPPDESVTVFKLITLYDEYSIMSGDLEIHENNTIPDTDHESSLLYNLVKVRCTLWYM